MMEMSHSVMSAGRNRERTKIHTAAAVPPIPGGTAALTSSWGASPVSEKNGSGTSLTPGTHSSRIEPALPSVEHGEGPGTTILVVFWAVHSRLR